MWCFLCLSVLILFQIRITISVSLDMIFAISLNQLRKSSMLFLSYVEYMTLPLIMYDMIHVLQGEHKCTEV